MHASKTTHIGKTILAQASALHRLSGVSTLDRIGIALSALCAAHCLTTAVAVLTLASFGGALLNPIIHEVGLVIAVILGLVALLQGVWRHGYVMPFAVGCFGLGMMVGALSLGHGDGEMLATLVGVATLALGHDLNFRAQR
jgi:hypothetical protein